MSSHLLIVGMDIAFQHSSMTSHPLLIQLALLKQFNQLRPRHVQDICGLLSAQLLIPMVYCRVNTTRQNNCHVTTQLLRARIFQGGSMAHKTLTHGEAIAFYNKFGAKQDKQDWYEEAALEALVAYSDFPSAHNVCEFGCGTGKLADQILASPDIDLNHYLALDSSPVMIELATERLGKHRAAEVQLTDGVVVLPMPPDTVDRLVTCYVIDLLSESDINQFITEAQRVLNTGGLLCAASLTPGNGPISTLVSSVWSGLHKFKPSLVGGCRPISLANRLSAKDWDIRHQQIVTAWSVSSELVIAAAR